MPDGQTAINSFEFCCAPLWGVLSLELTQFSVLMELHKFSTLEK